MLQPRVEWVAQKNLAGNLAIFMYSENECWFFNGISLQIVYFDGDVQTSLIINFHRKGDVCVYLFFFVFLMKITVQF